MSSQSLTRADKVRARWQRQQESKGFWRRLGSVGSRVPVWFWFVILAIPLAIVFGLTLVERLGGTRCILLGVALAAIAIAIYLWRIGGRARRNPQTLRAARGVLILGVVSLETFALSLILTGSLSWHVPAVLSAIGVLALIKEITDPERRWGFITTCVLAILVLGAFAVDLAQQGG